MVIDCFKIYTVQIPLRFSVTHTLAARDKSSSIIVCAYSQSGEIGFGECCPRSYVTGETLVNAKKNLSEKLLPGFVGKSFYSFEEMVACLGEISKSIPKNNHAAFCALEMSLLDLAGKVFSKSIGSVIGPPVQKRVRYSSVIASKDPEKCGKFALMMRMMGFKDIKIKVGKSLQSNMEILQQVRDNAGEKMSLRLDANGAWDGDEAIRQLEMMKKFSLSGIEQPVAAEDFEGMKHVTEARILPVIADESLCTMDDAVRLIESGACNIFNIRISKCGGILNSMAIYRKALEANLMSMLGAQVGETALLSAVGRHVACRCSGLKWYEGSYGKLLLKTDIASRSITIGFGGWARHIKGNGIGVAADIKKLRVYSTRDCQKVNTARPIISTNPVGSLDSWRNNGYR